MDALGVACHPKERYLRNGEMEQTGSFQSPVGGSHTLHQGDFRDVPLSSEYDAVITDPPYYDNVIYSEVSDFFYVWQKIVLGDQYSEFETEVTPREDSVVSNPSVGKDSEEFESELKECFSRINDALKTDGVLAFTYRHGGKESWGALLQSLCDEGFDVTATYPISANLKEFVMGDELSFSVIVVARPSEEREPTSWSALRRRIHKSAKRARKEVTEGQTLSEGDISVVELGRGFREYSKHHGKVHRKGEVMSASEVVDEIYEIIAGEVSAEEIYLSLLGMKDPSFDDVERLCRGTEVSPEDLIEKNLLYTEDGFELTSWESDSRISYIKEKSLTDMPALEKTQLFRHELDDDTKTTDTFREIEVTGEMIDIAKELAAVTGDKGYQQLFQG
jgi:adenine-specific DNA methylase